MKSLKMIKSVFVLLLLTVLLSCGSSGGNDSDSSNSTESGRVSLLITDAPSPDFDQINITLESIRFIGDDEEEGDEKEVTVFDEPRVINLLALQHYSDLLASTIIPVGTYSKIRLMVSQVELVKLNPDGTVLSTDLAKLPGNGKIDLNPGESFEIVDDEHLMIELDVDAKKSIKITETGSGKFIFRPVIFVNILGDEDLKLVILDGRVFELDDSSFKLCEAELLEVNDQCLEIKTSADTVYQNEQILVVANDSLDNNDVVTVLGKAYSHDVHALHIIIDEDDEVNNLALFSGESDTSVSVASVFDMTTDDDNDVLPTNTSLSVLIASGARVFDEYGTVLGASSIEDGTDVDVFGLALPDLIAATNVNAAFIIIDNEDEDDSVSGTIIAIDTDDEELTITVVSGSFSGDVCVDVDDAELFLLESDSDGVSSEKITVNDLRVGMQVDVYTGDDDDDSCVSAKVVLVTDS